MYLLIRPLEERFEIRPRGRSLRDGAGGGWKISGKDYNKSLSARLKKKKTTTDLFCEVLICLSVER